LKRVLSFAFIMALVSIPAFAAKNPSVVFPEDVKVGSTLVPAGHYNLTITGAGSDVQVTINQGKKAVVTFTAAQTPAKGLISITSKDAGKAAPSLQSIQLHDFNLVLHNAPQTGQ
jgi:hypothetical protein